MQTASGNSSPNRGSTLFESLYQTGAPSPASGLSNGSKPVSSVCDALHEPPSETCLKRGFLQVHSKAGRTQQELEDSAADDLFTSLYWYYTEKGYVNIVLSRCVHLM